MRLFIKNQLFNPEVTDYYLQNIGDGYEKAGYETVKFDSWEQISMQEGDLVLVSTPVEAWYPMKKGLPFIIWFQGIMPEESFLKHSDLSRYPRRFIISMLEKMALRKAKACFFVSEEMKAHYERKYRITISENYYIMPCGNEAIHKESFFYPGKYQKNVFCYAGALAKWQCVEQILAYYSRIERRLDGAELLLLIKDRAEGERLINKYGIKNYKIDYVSIDRLPETLQGVKYGFLLREDIDINRVATPTKFSSYLCNGIIPIMSDSLKGLEPMVKSSGHIVSISSFDDIDAFFASGTNAVSAEEVYEDFLNIYNTYFDKDRHVENIAKLAKAGVAR